MFVKKRALLLRYFKNLKFSKKLIISFFLVSILPIITIHFFSTTINNRYMSEKINELLVNDLEQTSKRINLKIESFANILYQIYVDNQIIENINILEKEKNKSAIAFYNINNKLKHFVESNSGIRSISIVCREGNTVTYDSKTGSSIDNIWRDYEDMRKLKSYLEAEKKNGIVITPTMIINDNNSEAHLFHMSKKMYDFKNLERGFIAVIIISIDEKVISNICNNANNTDNNFLFITDKNNYIVTYPNKKYINLKIKKNSIKDFLVNTNNTKEKNIGINSYVDNETNWMYYFVYNKKEMFNDMYNAQKALLIMGLGLLLFISILMQYFIKYFSKSVNKIVKGIHEIKRGNFNYKLNVCGKDEFGDISLQINIMADELNNLIEEIKEITEKKKEAEIRALEARINPHFLYNTLDAINWLAVNNKQIEISRMISNLGYILRYSIKDSNQKVTLKQEISWIERFLELYRLRYDNMFEYEICADEKIYDALIYKLIIQPFVENSLIHGFSKDTKKALIKITAVLSDDKKKLNIIIEDNGKGISEYKLKKIKGNKQNRCKSNVGINNTINRIKLYYKEDVYWEISSIRNIGTVVYLSVPYEKRLEK